MIINAVNDYLSSTVKKPFFVFTGDNCYDGIKSNIIAMGLRLENLSSFCKDDDKLPDIDALIGEFETLDVDARNKKILIVGIGEYLATIGEEYAKKILNRLKDFSIGSSKIVILLRGVEKLLKELASDPRFNERIYFRTEDLTSNLKIEKMSTGNISAKVINGYKKLLMQFEKNNIDNLLVETNIDFSKAMFNVAELKTFDFVEKFVANKNLQKEWGTSEKWEELLKDLMNHNNSIDNVFESKQFRYEDEYFINQTRKNNYESWLYFLYLKLNDLETNNKYVKIVLENTENSQDIINNLLNFIFNCPKGAKEFRELYFERKKAIKYLSEHEMAQFVISNRVNTKNRIYYLTDNTDIERQEIINWIVENGINEDIIKEIYPDLYFYVQRYVFKCQDIPELLTDYFDQYKKQKVENHINKDFISLVESNAIERKFNRLPTRTEILETIKKTQNTYLFWMDALGVEYLSFLEECAQKLGLSIKIHIAQAELPTITSINNNFYQNWDGNKHKEEGLDKVKHKVDGGFDFTKNANPIHLPKELEIIKTMMDSASVKLASKEIDKFLIVSDHGASRLAVLYKKEEKYDTNTKGEHSGRCSFTEPKSDLPFAAEAPNGYLVLADYGRFKGSRAANVEVHGGASLEEVVIPIIELELKNQNIAIRKIKDFVEVDYSKGAYIEFFIDKKESNVSVVYNNKAYIACATNENIYAVTIKEINRAGNYKLLVYEQDNLIGKLDIKAQGKSARTNSIFDDLF